MDKWAPHILQLLNFAITFLESLLLVPHFSNFLREVAKVTNNLKSVEVKIFNLSYWTKKKSYCNINPIQNPILIS